MKLRSSQKFSIWSLNRIYPRVVTPERFYRGSSLNMSLDSRFSLRLIRPKPCGGKSMRE